MQRIRSIGFDCLVFGVALLGCSESSIIGEDFVGDEAFSLFYADTVSLPIYTTKFDSLITSQSGRLLIGNSSDSRLGATKAEAFFILENLSESFSISENLKFDSVTLTLFMDGYTDYLDESEVTSTILVEQLNEELERLDDFNLYNNTEVDGAIGDLKLLAEQRFILATDRLRTLEITLDNQWGLELFEQLSDDSELSLDSEFKEFIKGFKIGFKETDSPFIGFASDSVSLTIYSSDNFTTPPESITYEFKVGFSPYYSKIEHTEVPEELAEINSLEDEISSNLTNNYGVIAGGLGYAVKLDTDPIRNSFLLTEDLLMVTTILELEWLDEGETRFLPDTVQVNFVNESLFDVGEQTYYMLRSDGDDFERNRNYSIDLSSIVSLLLSFPLDEKYYLLLSLQDFNTSTTTVLVGDRSFNSRLKIYTVSNNE